MTIGIGAPLKALIITPANAVSESTVANTGRSYDQGRHLMIGRSLAQPNNPRQYASAMQRLRFTDFDVGQVIGTGTVGTVYEVVEKSTNDVYALKLLLRNVGTDRLVVSRFEREILILSKLEHPNIVSYHGHGTLENQLFYVMELIRGETLKQVLAASGRLTWQEVAECGRQIASALQHAHNHGIIHRDLKPGNVYVTKQGRLKLGDFGIARDIHSLELTDTGLTVGTYWYMSPELVRGERELTGKSDLYALGCLLFEILTGQPPYQGDNFAQIFEQHLHATPPNVREFADCPEKLAKLIRSLLAKDPEERPFNARAVQGVLSELLSDAGVSVKQTHFAAGDRGAASVLLAQESLATRVQASTAREDVSWGKLAMLLLAIVVAILAAALAR
jgi:serine/threonine protein kinase